jgi:hypothetical protein
MYRIRSIWDGWGECPNMCADDNFRMPERMPQRGDPTLQYPYGSMLPYPGTVEERALGVSFSPHHFLVRLDKRPPGCRGRRRRLASAVR